jgi:hypothetical protein
MSGTPLVQESSLIDLDEISVRMAEGYTSDLNPKWIGAAWAKKRLFLDFFTKNIIKSHVALITCSINWTSREPDRCTLTK